MYLTLNQAAKAVKKSTSTISKYIKDGKLSVSERLEDGSFKIDPAELYRVFPEQHKTPDIEQSRTPVQTAPNSREIELLEKMNRQQTDMIQSLQDQIKEERDERQKMTIMLLEHQTKVSHQQVKAPNELLPEPAKKRWWRRDKQTESVSG